GSWMTTIRSYTRRSDLQDVTECPICCLRFERPLQLSCGHSFCGNCVDRLIADARGAVNRNDNFPEPMRGIAAPNIDQGVNQPPFNRMDQDIWWPLNRPQLVPPPGLGGIPHPPRYVLRNFNEEPPFFPRRAIGGSGPAENIIKCPECRQPTRVPPEGLPVNYRLQELLSHVAEASNLSNDQCGPDGTPLRKCLACDDVLSKGVYLLCRSCTGETVRQLCSMCCLRNHNGHDIEEKRFLTMKDVTVARDVVSEATGLGYQYVDMALNELNVITEATRDLIQSKAQNLLQEFESIVDGLQFDMLSSHDELEDKVAAAKGISDKLELLPRLVKELSEEFHNKIARVVNEFGDMLEKVIHEGAQDVDFDKLLMEAGSSKMNQHDAFSPTTSSQPRTHRPDMEERRTLGKTSSLMERKIRQHRLAQQHSNAHRKRTADARTRVLERGRQEEYVPDYWSLESDRERRDRLRDERRNGFLENDERSDGRRLHKMLLDTIAAGLNNHYTSQSASQGEEAKRSRSVEVVTATPPAVVDLEQRAERLIISPQRRRARNEGYNSTMLDARADDAEQVQSKCKNRHGNETDCSDEIDVTGDFMLSAESTQSAMLSSPSCSFKKRKFGGANMQVSSSPSSECREPGPSSSYVTFPDGDRNNGSSSGIDSIPCCYPSDDATDGEIDNIETLD
uniref:RING-type domain-containing protein n=1 Tax=Haemonchus contortus TaxID=6289 RepID=A0A7I4YWJ2_HAECO